MRLSIKQYAEALLSLEQEVGAERAKEAGKKFLGWLVRTKEMKKLSFIIREAERLMSERAGVAEVMITTAHTVDTKTKALLIRQAENIFPGKKIEASFMTDTDLIGGAKFRTDEMLYDASLAYSLKGMKKSLVK